MKLINKYTNTKADWIPISNRLCFLVIPKCERIGNGSVLKLAKMVMRTTFLMGTFVLHRYRISLTTYAVSEEEMLEGDDASDVEENTDNKLGKKLKNDTPGDLQFIQNL